MTPPVVAVIVGFALGTILFFMYGGRTNDQQEQRWEQFHSYSNTPNRYNNRGRNNVRPSTSSSGYDDECSICYTLLSSASSMSLACSHKYHRKCIQRWKEHSQGFSTCPICRAPF